jgi:cytochrome P450
VDLYGSDAEDFRPERWEEDLGLFRDEITTRWGYLPFNGGPRTCLGSKRFLSALMSFWIANLAMFRRIVDFALTEAAYTVVRTLQRFPIIKMPSDEIFEKTGREQQTLTIVLSVANGCRINFG